MEEDTKAQSKDKPTRLLAEKVGDRRPKGWPRARDDGTRVDVPDIKSRVPVSTELLNSDELAKVAAHCNERKTSAKACSVGFLFVKTPDALRAAFDNSFQPQLDR